MTWRELINKIFLEIPEDQMGDPARFMDRYSMDYPLEIEGIKPFDDFLSMDDDGEPSHILIPGK